MLKAFKFEHAGGGGAKKTGQGLSYTTFLGEVSVVSACCRQLSGMGCEGGL